MTSGIASQLLKSLDVTRSATMAEANRGAARAATQADLDDRYRADSGSRERRGRSRENYERRDQLDQLHRTQLSPPDVRQRAGRAERSYDATHYHDASPFKNRERPCDHGPRDGDRWAQREMDNRVRQEMEHRVTCALVQTSLKFSTVGAYSKRVKPYLRFMETLPADWCWTDFSCALWVLHTMEVKGAAKSTLLGLLPAFANMAFRATGHKRETSQKGSILQMLRQTINQKADDAQRKTPVGERELLRIFGAAEANLKPEQHLQLWAWSTVSYGGMLRCSEAEGLLWENAAFEQDAAGKPISLTLRMTAEGWNTFKTHKHGVEFHFKQAEKGGVCPVQALFAWRQFTRATQGEATGRIFAWRSDTATKLFKKVGAKALGCDEKWLGLHSLRAGAASDAEEKGWTISQIMFMGRWRSPCVLHYMRNGERMLVDMGQAAGKTLSVRPTMFSGNM